MPKVTTLLGYCTWIPFATLDGRLMASTQRQRGASTQLPKNSASIDFYVTSQILRSINNLYKFSTGCLLSRVVLCVNIHINTRLYYSSLQSLTSAATPMGKASSLNSNLNQMPLPKKTVTELCII